MDSSLNFVIGKVTSIEDERYGIIRFTVDNYIENSLATPMSFVDEVKTGDEVLLLELDTVFKTSFVYLKRKVDKDIQFRYKNKSINILSDSIEIKTPNSSIILKDDGDISVTGININIESSVSTKITGSVLPSETTPGPFCALPLCLFTGTPHSSDHTGI